MDAFFYEVFDEERTTLERFFEESRKSGGNDVSAGYTEKTIQEYAAPQPPASLISTRTQSVFPPDWRGQLEGILTRSTGYEHLAKYLRDTNADIPGGYLPLYCNRAVAEQAAMLWLALLRKLPRQISQFERFERDHLTGGECFGRTLLVVGVGNIGHQVVQIGCGLGMNVLGVDIVEKHEDVTYTTISDGLAKADVIVCTMNLTAENNGYFHYDLLRRAPKGVIFVNVARGELSPTADLLRLLDEGQLGGVGLDVYQDEQILAVELRSGWHPEKHAAASAIIATMELQKRPNAILTPHNAFNTTEALELKAQQSVQSVIAFMQNGEFPHPVPVI